MSLFRVRYPAPPPPPAPSRRAIDVVAGALENLNAEQRVRVLRAAIALFGLHGDVQIDEPNHFDDASVGADEEQNA